MPAYRCQSEALCDLTSGCICMTKGLYRYNLCCSFPLREQDGYCVVKVKTNALDMGFKILRTCTITEKSNREGGSACNWWDEI